MKHTRRSKASHRAPSKYPTHVVIPDTQCRPGISTEYLRAIGNFIADKRPSTIVQLGDFSDMASLNSYAVGKVESEGCRYVDDIANAREAMTKLTTPWRRMRNYTPKMVLTTGNHEFRIQREAESNPKLIGKLDIKDLQYERFGWDVRPFLSVAKIDNVSYSHYFISGVMSRPVSSAAALLRTRQCSATMGHVQRQDWAIHPQTQYMALFAGIAYEHDEVFLTVQGNDTRRGIWVKHEVQPNGVYDVMFVSLDFLKRRYS